jgi:hypothetical protein
MGIYIYLFLLKAKKATIIPASIQIKPAKEELSGSEGKKIFSFC